jgi:hypothetical protein
MLCTAFKIVMALAFSQPALGADAPIDIAVARQSLDGAWEGKLEYLDYSANKWFGIPVKTLIETQPDGVTTIRKSDFDDGPKVGIVRITSVEMFDPKAATVSSASFRKGRSVEVDTSKLAFASPPTDATHWTMIEETTGKDNNRPALIRVTVTRNGDAYEALKQVDFQDDDKQEWLTRNRTRLMRKDHMRSGG